ncbi:alpha/beta fold hydrolase [Ensifer adhaerens]|uniref:alpha/beta fold hydrolase n=1 Tax=Ensifer adhaerens TaxID=106592 RepID=UPI00098F5EA5|nr:alpha/beta hydrolase [Ensifer adhaerens]
MVSQATDVRAGGLLSLAVHILLSVFIAAGLISTAAATEKPRWRTLPATPQLPTTNDHGFVSVDGAKIWYAMFGSGEPVIMLHGGLANSNYWGHQVPDLAKNYRVVVMDSRGHGRSTRDERPFSYDLMSSDVVALMDHLDISQAAIIGWSDGAIIGLKLAIHNPDRIRGVFAFAANSDPSGIEDISDSIVFDQYLQRVSKEYKDLSSTPDEYDDFLGKMSAMWASQPEITPKDLRSIGTPVWIVDGDHEEVIRRKNTLLMADSIPNAGLLIQPEVSHFSLLQGPQQFTADILRFLQAH